MTFVTNFIFVTSLIIFTNNTFCQAQSKIQLSWAELALILKYPAPARPPARASTIEAS